MFEYNTIPIWNMILQVPYIGTFVTLRSKSRLQCDRSKVGLVWFDIAQFTDVKV